jgi:hypothetical protein
MADTIMHCFDPGSGEAEGKIIGSLLAGYGELELEMAACLITATGNFDGSLQALFKTHGEERRITTADSRMKATYVIAGLGIIYKRTISDMHWCRRIRNQYAHCQWFYDHITKQLCFVDLEAVAKSNSPIGNLESHKIPVDVKILKLQMDFFVYVRRSFGYLDESCQRYLSLQRNPAAVLSNPVHAIPPAMVQPPLHN